MITMFNVLRDQKLWMALTFLVPLILTDLMPNFTWKISQFWLIFNRKFYCSVLKYSFKKQSGPSCSKLTMSLVNDLLKFTSSDTQIC